MQRELRNRAPRDREAELRRRLAAFEAGHPELLVTHTPGSPYEVAVTDRDGLPELIREHDLAVFLDRAKAVTSGMAGHDALPLGGMLYTAVGGLPADPRRADDFPAEGLCAICQMPVRAERPQDPWVHTGRKPGDPR